MRLWIKSFIVAINDSCSSYLNILRIFKTPSTGSEVYETGYARTQNNGTDQQ